MIKTRFFIGVPPLKKLDRRISKSTLSIEVSDRQIADVDLRAHVTGTLEGPAASIDDVASRPVGVWPRMPNKPRHHHEPSCNSDPLLWIGDRPPVFHTLTSRREGGGANIESILVVTFAGDFENVSASWADATHEERVQMFWSVGRVHFVEVATALMPPELRERALHRILELDRTSPCGLAEKIANIGRDTLAASRTETIGATARSAARRRNTTEEGRAYQRRLILDAALPFVPDGEVVTFICVARGVLVPDFACAR